MARRFPARGLVLVGAGDTLVDLALLECSAQSHSLPLFMVTTVFGGIAYGLLFSGGLGLIATHAPAHHRGGTVAAVYLVAYILQGAIALTMGLVATASGLSTALLLGTILIGSLALLVVAVAGSRGGTAEERPGGRGDVMTTRQAATAAELLDRPHAGPGRRPLDLHDPARGTHGRDPVRRLP